MFNYYLKKTTDEITDLTKPKFILNDLPWAVI